MRKNIIIKTLIILNSIILSAQEPTKTSTILVGSNENVILFFDSPIVQGICGHSNYQFAFNTQTQDNYGIIRGETGPESNIHIITENGNVFSFILKHSKNVSKYNYFFSYKDAVGNINGPIESPIKLPVEPVNIETKNNNTEVTQTSKDSLSLSPKFNEDVITSDLQNEDFKVDSNSSKSIVKDKNKTNEDDVSDSDYETNTLEYYNKYSRNLKYKTQLKRVFVINEGIILHIQGIYQNKNEIYYSLKIENTSGVDYGVNFIRLAKVSKKALKTSGVQAIDIPYKHSYNLPSIIKSNSYQEFALVLDRFGIDQNKKILIEVNEKNGERRLMLYLDSQIVNNPFN